MSEIHDLEHDFRIHDAYVAFSAEVARLALLAPVVLSFFIVIKGDDPNRQELIKLLEPEIQVIAWSLITLTISVALALGHRYFAIDFMSEHLRLLRKGKKCSCWKSFTSKASTACIFGAPVFLVIGWALMLYTLFKLFVDRGQTII